MSLSLPDLGFGTYTLTDEHECVASVRRALDAGYRHIDTAQVYENEALVGDAIDESSVPREAVTVATKLWIEHLTRDDVLDTAENSRKRLGVDSIDLLYVHWPSRTYDPDETLPALDELVERGVVDHVGLSNFVPSQLDDAGRILDARIAAHEVECHPLLPQEELLEYAREDGHELVAAVPLAKGDVFDIPEIQRVAEKYDASPTQVSLAWQLKRGVVPIPKARGDHIEANLGARELASNLDDTDIELIDGIETRRRLVDPERAPW